MSQRFIAPLSETELNRRWAALAKIMRQDDLDALVVQNSNDWVGGYIRWVTGAPANNGYPRTALFFGPGDMTIIEMGGRGDMVTPDAADPSLRGVTQILTNPSFSSVGGTLAEDARLAADELSRRGVRRVGLINPDGMYHGLAAPLQRAAFTFVDATDAVDRVKAVKSAEEQALTQLTATLQDEVMAAMAEFIKPGLHDFEIAAYAQFLSQQKGAEQGIFINSSSPAGKAAVFRPRHMQGRRIEHGDVISLLIETNGPAGYYTELGRTFSLGTPKAGLVAANRAARDAQRQNLDWLKPGARTTEIFAKHNLYMRGLNMPAETRLHCHGQGYDMVERPLIRDDDDMEILEGMNIVVHPGYIDEEAFALVCDNYLIGPEGPGPSLHKTGQGLIII